MTTTNSRGYFTFAQNGTHDYLRMAYALALSLKASQSSVNSLSVGVTPGTEVPDEYRWAFDQVIEIPWGDAAEHSSWKLENEWKAIHMTPYDETVKLDCDMLFMSDVSDWWDTMSTREMWCSTTAKTLRGEVVTSDYYRKTFTANGLPNVYTAFMFFKKTELTHEVFDMASHILKNWDIFINKFMDDPLPRELSTDVAFALAIKILDVVDECVNPVVEFPYFTHMKTMIQDWDHSLIPEEWNKHVSVYFNDELELKIGRYRQLGPVHYHMKDFVTDEMISFYENKLK